MGGQSRTFIINLQIIQNIHHKNIATAQKNSNLNQLKSIGNKRFRNHSIPLCQEAKKVHVFSVNSKK
jgi:hypothetical protein